MSNLRVTIVRLCKTDRGWLRYPIVFGKNGRIKPGCVLVAGEEREFPEGRYQIRYYMGKKMVYRDVGKSAGEALAARDHQMKILGAKDAARMAGVRLEEDSERLPLSNELKRFLRDVRGRGKNVAAAVYEYSVEEFLKTVRKEFVNELTVEDLTKFQEALRKRGMADRTVHNRHAHVIAFYRWCNIPVEDIPRPSYEKPLPEVYTPEELAKLFGVIKRDKQYMTYEMLLKCGLREQEAMYLEWGDVDLKRGVLRVKANPLYDFKVKDAEQRDIPIPNDLLARMKQYKAEHPKEYLVTETINKKPNTKLLYILKRIARRAELNCGRCKSCVERKECEKWFLHKFRATYITTLLRSGVDLRTVMKFSGHSDLASVMRYLSPAGDEAIRGKVNTIQWMV